MRDANTLKRGTSMRMYRDGDDTNPPVTCIRCGHDVFVAVGTGSGKVQCAGCGQGYRFDRVADPATHQEVSHG